MSSSNEKLAVVLVRGFVHLSAEVQRTLDYLRLSRKHVAVVVDATPENLGMLRKVESFVTYGTVDEATFKAMVEKRGEVVGGGKASEAKKVDAEKVAKEYFSGKVKLREFEEKFGLKPYFRLAPPVGGFERKGIKVFFNNGGVLGNRKDKIKDLILRML